MSAENADCDRFERYQRRVWCSPAHDVVFPRARRIRGAASWFVGVRAYAAGLSLLLLITIFYSRILAVNSTTVGFTFLLAILSASAIWGLGVSGLMSLAATLAFDYFFLPPVHSLDIADPQDWVALSAFLVTAVLGSSLSARAHDRATEAELRRRELERLYAFSQKLLGAASVAELSRAIPQHILDCFDAQGTALYLLEGRGFFRAGEEDQELPADRLHATATLATMRAPTGAEQSGAIKYAQLRLGEKVLGSIGLAGPLVSKESVEALGSLIAVSVERVSAGERLVRMEAQRESEKFKAVMLDAIAHDFRTPLTCIKSSVTALLSDLRFEREQQRELLSVVEEECDRIDTLLGKASELARLESGEVKLQRRAHSIRELINTTLGDCKSVLRERSIACEVAHAEMLIFADLPWARSVLVHLISNAHLYSSPGLPITIRSAAEKGFAFLSVADQGPGIDEEESEQIFKKFYGGKDQELHTHGTGMGLPIARAIVEAHGGTIQLESRRGRGSTFTISLPIVQAENMPVGACQNERGEVGRVFARQ